MPKCHFQQPPSHSPISFEPLIRPFSLLPLTQSMFLLSSSLPFFLPLHLSFQPYFSTPLTYTNRPHLSKTPILSFSSFFYSLSPFSFTQNRSAYSLAFSFSSFSSSSSTICTSFKPFLPLNSTPLYAYVRHNVWFNGLWVVSILEARI